MLTTDSGEIIQRIDTRAEFDALFQTGATVTAGALTELKFLIDRTENQLYFLPPKFAFHFDFYQQVLNGPLDNAAFNQRAYNRPDRDFIPGTVTSYDSFVDPVTAKRGQICYSYWPTDKFDVTLLSQSRDALRGGLTFLPPGSELAFRPGGPIQQRIVEELRAQIVAAGLTVRTNLEISRGLGYIALSVGTAVGKLVIVEPGAAIPVLTRTDVVAFLGDVPADAPPVAAIFTTTVQTYNSHLGIKYRQDDTPYFYKSFTAAELDALRALAGKFVSVFTDVTDASVAEATAEQAKDYLDRVKPKGRIRLSPNLGENSARGYADLAECVAGPQGWEAAALAAYGRKTCGVVELSRLHLAGTFAPTEPGAPQVIAPAEPIGIPANWYVRFMRKAVDGTGRRFADRAHDMIGDSRFNDPVWRARALAKLRYAMVEAELPKSLRKNVLEQVVLPYLDLHPYARSARLRSSSPVVEDSGGGLPNMAGAFDSDTARWTPGKNADKTAKNCLSALATSLQYVWASVWNDRALAELTWHNVDLDIGSVTMAVLVTPNEDNELANGVVRVNRDLAGFFSVTGETQFGENLVTNPEAGATPDTWIDGNYDVLDGVERQDISYERESNRHPGDPKRPHAFTDNEIRAVYEAMRKLRPHFAELDGRAPEDYLDECEVKITAAGRVLIKQERRWVD